MNERSTKLRVAFFAEILIEEFDGASRTMHQIIKRIPNDDFEFRFICGVAPQETMLHEVVIVPSISLPINRSYSMALPFISKKSLENALNEFDPDVIHIATPSPLGHYAKNYALKHDIPLISVYHTHFLSYVDYYLRKAKFLIPTVKRAIVRNMKSFYEQCDTVYVPSPEMIDDLHNHGFKTNNMELWQRGIDRNMFHPDKRDVALLYQITSNNNKNILFVSRLVWEKNLDTLIHIYDILSEDYPEYNLIIAGDGVARETLERLMPKAFFTGMLSHHSLSYIYASSDVFLFTSDTESYGNVVVEALSSGLPCVIAHGGGSRGFIHQGDNGFTCSTHNARQYIQKMLLILENADVYDQMSKVARQSTSGMNWEKLTDRYFNKLKVLDLQYNSLTEAS